MIEDDKKALFEYLYDNNYKNDNSVFIDTACADLKMTPVDFNAILNSVFRSKPIFIIQDIHRMIKLSTEGAHWYEENILRPIIDNPNSYYFSLMKTIYYANGNSYKTLDEIYNLSNPRLERTKFEEIFRAFISLNQIERHQTTYLWKVNSIGETAIILAEQEEKKRISAEAALLFKIEESKPVKRRWKIFTWKYWFDLDDIAKSIGKAIVLFILLFVLAVILGVFPTISKAIRAAVKIVQESPLTESK
jgi:hypothetical protein